MTSGEAGRTRTRVIVLGVLALLVAAAATWYFVSNGGFFGGDGADDQVQATGGGVSIPQVPSLRMFIESGTVFVENDGNVTMSDVEVRDVGGAVLCSMGVISPGDRQACDEASGSDGLTAYGRGPQGQEVEDTLG